MADVVIELGGKEILRVPLKGQSMTIGRDAQCDLHLDNRALSRRHAQIEKRGAAIWVRDLNSANGTYVNGGRIHEPQVLNGGDVVELGRYQVRIEGVENAHADTPVLTLTGPEGRHRFAMVGDEIIIGRAPSCDIAIGHKSISRRHLRIALDGGDFIAEDLGSQNGTRLNAKRINGPTSFRAGDKLHMSEFTIEVGYLEPQGAGPDKRSRTMMIDRSELAKAAYVEGDGFVGMVSNAGNIALGRTPDGDMEDEVSEQLEFKHAGHSLPSEAEDEPSPPPPPPQPPPPPPPQKAVVGPKKIRGVGAPPEPLARASEPSRDLRAPEPSRKPKHPPWITVSHGDASSDHDLQLTDDVTLLAEDGTTDDGTSGRSYADQGYVVFVKSPGGVVATAAGDRRLVSVNGKACLHKTLAEGDVVEFGLLSIVFHVPG